MSRQNCEVLYAKYNSARRPDCRVTTEICEDANGLFVRKRADAPAREHLERIYRNSLSLRDYYRDIRVIPVEKGEGELRFSYIQGRTLAEQIDVQHFDRERFVAQMNGLLSKVLAVKEQFAVPFEMTEGFEALFGRVELDGVPALNPANIDSLLTNFVENDEGICCIDCEWVCPFPVPVDFIRYRVLLYLYVTQLYTMLNGASEEEMLGWFGFTGRDIATYRHMDDAFQQRVHGEGRKYIYTSQYGKSNWSIDYLEHERQEKQVLEVVNRNKTEQIGNLEHTVGDLQGQIYSKDAHIRNLSAQIQSLMADYQNVTNAFFWRVTKPARVTLDAVKKFLHKNESVYLFLRAVKDTARHGGTYAKERREAYLEQKRKTQAPNSWPSREEQALQRQAKFPRAIRFSVVVPLYNTPDKFLRRMIKSVQDQTYANWELCLADGSDGEHASVGRICRALARKDARIRYRRLEKNLGISGNTNACIDMATGEYIALFDHDDVLHPSALFEVMKAVCERDADFIYTDESIFHQEPADVFSSHFKSDYAPDTLRSYNYICHLTAFKKALLEKTGGAFRSQFDGSQDFDLILRLTEQAEHIVHIPKVLYYWRSHAGSVASSVEAKPYTVDAGKAALAEHLERVGLKGTVLDSRFPSTYRVQYDIEGEPLVSIVIPNMDHVDDLKKCIDSITEKSTWNRREIIIVENNSQKVETFDYYRSLEDRPEIRVVNYEGGFNFSAICNCGARAAKGDYILLLNNDIQVITPNWLEEMLMYAQRGDVGAVGAMLYYPDDTIQHAGIIVGIGGSAGHSHKGFPRGDYGYLLRLTLAQDLSAVTGACCMVPRRVWEEIDGLDESFAVAFNDVDLCLRIRKTGYLIVWTPYAELYHYESKSRGYEDTPEKMERFQRERTHLRQRWGDVIDAGDPYYNPNLALDREDFSFR